MTHGVLLTAALEELARVTRLAWPDCEVVIGPVVGVASPGRAFVNVGTARREPFTVGRRETLADLQVGLLLPGEAGTRSTSALTRADFLIAAVTGAGLALGRAPAVGTVQYGADDLGRAWLQATVSVALEEGQP